MDQKIFPKPLPPCAYSWHISILKMHLESPYMFRWSPSPETFLKIPACRKEIKVSRQSTQFAIPPSKEQPAPRPFSSSSQSSAFTFTRLLKSKTMGSWQLVPGWPLELPLKPPLLWLSSELCQPSLGSPVASSMLSPSLPHCPQI